MESWFADCETSELIYQKSYSRERKEYETGSLKKEEAPSAGVALSIATTAPEEWAVWSKCASQCVSSWLKKGLPVVCDARTLEVAAALTMRNKLNRKFSEALKSWKKKTSTRWERWAQGAIRWLSLVQKQTPDIQCLVFSHALVNVLHPDSSSSRPWRHNCAVMIQHSSLPFAVRLRTIIRLSEVALPEMRRSAESKSAVAPSKNYVKEWASKVPDRWKRSFEQAVTETLILDGQEVEDKKVWTPRVCQLLRNRHARSKLTTSDYVPLAMFGFGILELVFGKCPDEEAYRKVIGKDEANLALHAGMVHLDSITSIGQLRRAITLLYFLCKG